jgi:hypothetical protein
MLKNYDPRARAVEAVRILNQFIGDFTVGTRGLEIYELPRIAAHVSPRIRKGLNRMAISYLVISLAKWEEFSRRYRAILPDDSIDACRSLRKKVIDRGIVDFRNKVVGHIVDDDTKGALTYSEIDQRLDRVLNGSLEDFLVWINNPAENTFPNSVVAITEHVRDRLQDRYGIGAEGTIES